MALGEGLGARCLECDEPFSQQSHTKLCACRLCSFASVCPISFFKHGQEKHNLIWKIPLIRCTSKRLKRPCCTEMSSVPKKLFCGCERFATFSSLKMTSHLTKCAEGQGKCQIILPKEKKSNVSEADDSSRSDVIEKSSLGIRIESVVSLSKTTETVDSVIQQEPEDTSDSRKVKAKVPKNIANGQGQPVYSKNHIMTQTVQPQMYTNKTSAQSVRTISTAVETSGQTQKLVNLDQTHVPVNQTFGQNLYQVSVKNLSSQHYPPYKLRDRSLVPIERPHPNKKKTLREMHRWCQLRQNQHLRLNPTVVCALQKKLLKSRISGEAVQNQPPGDDTLRHNIKSGLLSNEILGETEHARSLIDQTLGQIVQAGPLNDVTFEQTMHSDDLGQAVPPYSFKSKSPVQNEQQKPVIKLNITLLRALQEKLLKDQISREAAKNKPQEDDTSGQNIQAGLLSNQTLDQTEYSKPNSDETFEHTVQSGSLRVVQGQINPTLIKLLLKNKLKKQSLGQSSNRGDQLMASLGDQTSAKSMPSEPFEDQTLGKKRQIIPLIIQNSRETELGPVENENLGQTTLQKQYTVPASVKSLLKKKLKKHCLKQTGSKDFDSEIENQSTEEFTGSGIHDEEHVDSNYTSPSMNHSLDPGRLSDLSVNKNGSGSSNNEYENDSATEIHVAVNSDRPWDLGSDSDESDSSMLYHEFENYNHSLMEVHKDKETDRENSDARKKYENYRKSHTNEVSHLESVGLRGEKESLFVSEKVKISQITESLSDKNQCHELSDFDNGTKDSMKLKLISAVQPSKQIESLDINVINGENENLRKCKIEFLNNVDQVVYVEMLQTENTDKCRTKEDEKASGDLIAEESPNSASPIYVEDNSILDSNGKSKPSICDKYFSREENGVKIISEDGVVKYSTRVRGEKGYISFALPLLGKRGLDHETKIENFKKWFKNQEKETGFTIKECKRRPWHRVKKKKKT